MKQQYPRGTKVKVLLGHQIWKHEDGETKWFDAQPDMVGREAVIEYSYAEKFGPSDDAHHNKYSIRFLDNGSSLAWKEVSELEFVDEGGEHLITEAKAMYDKTIAEETDMKNIVAALKSYLTGVEPEGFSSAGVLKIFEVLNFPTQFHTNGEFYILNMEWLSALPGVLHILLSSSAEEAKKALSPKALEAGVDPVALWEAFGEHRPSQEEIEQITAEAEKNRVQGDQDEQEQNPAR